MCKMTTPIVEAKSRKNTLTPFSDRRYKSDLVMSSRPTSSNDNSFEFNSSIRENQLVSMKVTKECGTFSTAAF